MKTLKISAPLIASLLLFFVPVASASSVPSYNVVTTSGNTQIQITILNADPNAQAVLYYPVNSSTQTLSLGNTNSAGQMATTIDPSSYNPTIGGVSYVRVNGIQSNSQQWPSYSAQSSSGSVLSLTPPSIMLAVGETRSVSLSSNTNNLGIVATSNNTNPSVAAGTVSGTQVNIMGLSVGSTAMNVCASNVGCSTLYVTVQTPSAAVPSQTTTVLGPVSVSPSTITIYAGESRQAMITGGGNYSVSSHSNSAVSSATIVGNVLTVTGLIAGTDNMGVCSSSGGTISCVSFLVNVLRLANTGQTSSTSSSTISFSRTDVSLDNIGQSYSVTINGSGSGSYYVTANSDADSVTSMVEGSTLTLAGFKVGGSNITVCQTGGACGNVYAFVPSSDSNIKAIQTQVVRDPTLKSFTVESNSLGGQFMGQGAVLTIGFTTSDPIVKKTIRIAGGEVPVYGSGSGPYTAPYTITGSERLPIPVYISYTNALGVGGEASFSLGSAAPEVPASIGLRTFTKVLQNGSTGTEVTALQVQLKTLGVYSGPITGKFGALTEAAVKRYQAKHGLKQAGVTGPATRELLNKGI